MSRYQQCRIGSRGRSNAYRFVRSRQAPKFTAVDVDMAALRLLQHPFASCDGRHLSEVLYCKCVAVLLLPNEVEERQ